MTPLMTMTGTITMVVAIVIAINQYRQHGIGDFCK